MQTIRSFVAIPLASDVRRAAVKLIKRIAQPDDGIKWVPTDNLHLTLKFLGDVDNVEVPRVCDVIRRALEQETAFELHFAGTGGFPAIDRPRVLYAAIAEPTGALSRIVERLEVDLAELGFKREPRDYTPHLTLGRTKSGSRRASDAVIERLRAADQTQLGTMVVDQVQMIASFLDKQGPTYQIMDTVEL